MRRMILPLMLLVGVACQSATVELTEEQKAAIADTVSAIHAEHLRVWAEVDVDRGMSYFQNSPDLLYAFEGWLMRGFGTIHDTYAAVFEGVASVEMTFAESHTVVLARDVVCVMAQGTSASVDTAGVTGPESPFAITLVYVRRDGEWKVALAHESLPTPEPM